jgi:hypothetical protein
MAANSTRWAIKHSSRNRLDGYREWLAHENCVPMLFTTRTAARAHIVKKMAIYSRPDLRREPHGWKTPRVIRVKIAEVA